MNVIKTLEVLQQLIAKLCLHHRILYYVQFFLSELLVADASTRNIESTILHTTTQPVFELSGF